MTPIYNLALAFLAAFACVAGEVVWRQVPWARRVCTCCFGVNVGLIVVNVWLLWVEGP